MGRKRISPLSVQLLLADLVLVPAALALATWLRASLPFGQGGALPLDAVQLPWYVYLIALVAWSSGLILSGTYDPERVLRWFHEAWRVTVASGLAILLMAGGLYFAFRDMSRLQFGYSWALALALLLGFRAVLRVYYRVAGRTRPGWRSRILIAGAGDLGQRLATLILDQSRWGLDLVGYLDDDPQKHGTSIEGAPVLGFLDDLPRVIESRRVEEVWIALPARAHERLSQVVTLAEKLPVRVKVAPDYFSMALVHAKAEILGGIPLIGLREPVIEGIDRVIKRLFDLVVGGLSVIVAAVPMTIIGILIRLDSPGPALFRQQRVGENGRLFDMLKFRTMVAQAESLADQVLVTTEDGQVIHKHKSDPRVTRIGRWLRRYSLDELPQLFNVLRGEMTMVGPRPEMPWLVDRYEPWQRKRFAVPQGITGWWQVNGRSDKPMHLNTEDDLFYVYNYSLWLDLRILLMTPIAALRGRGAF
jgi:exopolysaccharide biosynthesis polyprenyl glycosylphosphotransferase